MTSTRNYADGDRVYMATRNGKREGVVESAMLVGTRHPGYIYTVREANGSCFHTAQGLLLPAAG